MVIGRGCVADQLSGEVAGLPASVVAVIADRGLAQAGVLDTILDGISTTVAPVCALIGVDPDLGEVERAAQEAITRGADGVLVVGGGSALCAGKAVAMRLRNPAPLDRYHGRDRLISPPAPTIAVPTTAGSGSEVSTVVVLHDPHRSQHLVIRGRGYEPDVALLDGELLRSLPRRPMVEAALDALSHCYEALWARRATPVTDALALAAAATIRGSLPPALEGEAEAMQELMVASAMANLACGNSELGLVHALSSAPDVHLPHGYQNGVLLPHVAAFNRPHLGPVAAVEVDHLDAFYAELGFSPHFTADELSGGDAELMIQAALGNPFRANNRRNADEGQLRELMATAAASSAPRRNETKPVISDHG
jgi:alcohol dehydrogenase class IV